MFVRFPNNDVQKEKWIEFVKKDHPHYIYKLSHRICEVI